MPPGWVAEPYRGSMRLSPPGSEVVRIDVTSAPREDYGVVRTAALAGDAVFVQIPEADRPGAHAPVQTTVGGRPAGLVEWSYARDGSALSRRHWAVELPAAIVHVSCVAPRGPLPRECDEVAASVKPIATSSQGGER